MKLNIKYDLVMHVLTSLDYGGVEKHMEIIACAGEHSCMRHVFVAIGIGGAVEKKLRARGAVVLCLGKKSSIPSMGAVRALFELFKNERPLAVHTHGAEANFHGLLAAWLARVPVRIGEEIGIPSHSSKAQAVFRLVYSTAHCVIGISQAVTDWLVKSREVPLGKATLIYNPVQLPNLYAQKRTPDGVFRIAFVGRLEPVKNPVALLDAVISLLSIGVPCELWIVGDGSQRAALEKTISSMGLETKVRLFGYQSEPESLVRQCDIYVQPSLSEGFGIALVEAMGCGLPVIATAVGGAPEIIEQGQTGWLLPQASSELIAGALNSAWDLGTEKLREMGLNARASVEGRFDPANYIAQIQELYEELMNNRAI